jgi:hypothetical protein
METSQKNVKKVGGENCKCTKGRSLLELGETSYVTLVNELKPFVNFELTRSELLRMIDRIRSIERGLVKRNLRTEEAILKDKVLRMNRTLRSMHDIIEITMLPSDLKYLIETGQMTYRKASKEATKRRLRKQVLIIISCKILGIYSRS